LRRCDLVLIGQEFTQERRVICKNPVYIKADETLHIFAFVDRPNPTVAVDKGTRGAKELLEDLDPAIDRITFQPLGGDPQMTWEAAFDANYSDGVLVLHHGRVVYERYAGCLGPDTLHGLLSATASLTGLMAEQLIGSGLLGENALVGDLLPELKQSGFGDATVRQVMDMTTALEYSEDYSDPNAEVWKFAEAGSSQGYFDFLATVKKNGNHGERFIFRTINADALGWILARIKNQSIADLFSWHSWRQVGADREAFYLVDALGTPFASGGFNATLRDTGRFGMSLLRLAPSVIHSILEKGDVKAFAKAGYDFMSGWSYRSMWWSTNNSHNAFTARGVHGQTIWVDPKVDMVIVRFASHPDAAPSASDSTSLPAYHAVAEYLIAHDKTPLRGQKWIVKKIGGRRLIANTEASLYFAENGGFHGNGSCNGFGGHYDESEGNKLTFKHRSSKLAGCPEDRSSQEQHFQKLLYDTQSYVLDKRNGTLKLKTKSGKTILLERAPF